MKKLTPAKKLQLARESLVQLGDVQLRHVVGGDPSLINHPCGTSHVIEPGQ